MREGWVVNLIFWLIRTVSLTLNVAANSLQRIHGGVEARLWSFPDRSREPVRGVLRGQVRRLRLAKGFSPFRR